MSLKVVVEESEVLGVGGEGGGCLTDEGEVMERRERLMRLGIYRSNITKQHM